MGLKLWIVSVEAPWSDDGHVRFLVACLPETAILKFLRDNHSRFGGDAGRAAQIAKLDNTYIENVQEPWLTPIAEGIMVL